MYGISNQQIASRLFLSESTVKSHIYKLYKKLDVHSRHDAVKLVRMNNGLTERS
ncbi:LuxR C-terminal-related transcriptional regulator [Escherichia coli]|nr:LuxR C-terminal-related transcriptional regulator [Escherichia coli]MCV5919222.1 LuxR C-terminal-related transcriptional regulator [Escherichia coli]